MNGWAHPLVLLLGRSARAGEDAPDHHADDIEVFGARVVAYASSVAGRNAALWYDGIRSQTPEFPCERGFESRWNRTAGVWSADDAISRADVCRWVSRQPEVMPSPKGEEASDEQRKSKRVRRGSPGPTAAPLGRQETSPERAPSCILAAFVIGFILLHPGRLSGECRTAMGDPLCPHSSMIDWAPSGAFKALPLNAPVSAAARYPVGAGIASCRPFPCGWFPRIALPSFPGSPFRSQGVRLPPLLQYARGLPCVGSRAVRRSRASTRV